MTNYTYTYSDGTNPNNGQKIDSIVGMRSDRPEYRYVLELAPNYRWRRYPKFLASGVKVGVSDVTGFGDSMNNGLFDILQKGNALATQQRIRYMRMQLRLNVILGDLEHNEIPQMFDPDFETS